MLAATYAHGHAVSYQGIVHHDGGHYAAPYAAPYAAAYEGGYAAPYAVPYEGGYAAPYDGAYAAPYAVPLPYAAVPVAYDGHHDEHDDEHVINITNINNLVNKLRGEDTCTNVPYKSAVTSNHTVDLFLQKRTFSVEFCKLIVLIRTDVAEMLSF